MSEQKREIPKPLLIGAGLLGAAHFPYVLKQFQTLWSLDYYQFFPFAFLVFALMLKGRRTPGVIKLDRWTAVLAVADIGMLLWGSLMVSPWSVYVAFVIYCFMVARSCLDSEFDTNLGYLALLLAITIRPPLAKDVQLIAGLQSLTTKVGSRILEFFGYLHFRDGNVLEFPGKRFMVEEACSGVQSLFAVMFLGCLIICGYRRTRLHAVLVLISAAGFAGFMNVVRICAISVAWADFDYDLSTGWQHDTLGYVTLGLAGFLVLSADTFFGIFFGPVPDTRGTGVSQVFRNPLIMLWNRCFQLKKRAASEESPELARQPWHSSVAIFLGGIALVAVGLQLAAI